MAVGVLCSASCRAEALLLFGTPMRQPLWPFVTCLGRSRLAIHRQMHGTHCVWSLSRCGSPHNCAVVGFWPPGILESRSLRGVFSNHLHRYRLGESYCTQDYFAFVRYVGSDRPSSHLRHVPVQQGTGSAIRNAGRQVTRERSRPRNCVPGFACTSCIVDRAQTLMGVSLAAKQVTKRRSERHHGRSRNCAR